MEIRRGGSVMWLVRHGTFQRFEYIEVATLAEAVEVNG